MNIDTSHRATAFRRGRQGTAIDTIVIHWWGDPSKHPTFDGTVSFFERGGNLTSAHYVVEAGRVAQMVDDADTAYHAGDWGVNLRSIGIECNPRASDEDKATVAELVLMLRAKHPTATILEGHEDIISTDCPGAYYPPNVTLAPWLNPAPLIVSTTTTEDEMTITTLRSPNRLVIVNHVDKSISDQSKQSLEFRQNFMVPGVVDGNDRQVDVTVATLLVSGYKPLTL